MTDTAAVEARKSFKATLPESVAWFVARTRYGLGVRFNEMRYCATRPVNEMEREAREWLKAGGWWYHNRAHAWFPPNHDDGLHR
jgi:hypothetical protein